jgi:hypothetical protein
LRTIFAKSTFAAKKLVTTLAESNTIFANFFATNFASYKPEKVVYFRAFAAPLEIVYFC